jgi:hypothetical protein
LFFLPYSCLEHQGAGRGQNQIQMTFMQGRKNKTIGAYHGK